MEALPPLLQYWQTQTPAAREQLCQEHGLYGIWSRYGLTSPADHLKTLKHRNLLFLTDYYFLQQNALEKTGTSLVPLKGLSLLRNIYNLHERPLTDMDVYTSMSPEVFLPFFANEGYVLQNEIKWKYTQHKYVFFKKTEFIDLTLEVHTQLIVRDEPWLPVLTSDGCLQKDDEFLYLCYHWAEQHTCLKLFWLFDLYLYWQKNSAQLSHVWEKAERLQLTPSLLAAYWALKNAFNLELPQHPTVNSYRSRTLARHLSCEKMFWLHQRRWTYLTLKFLLKPSLKDNIAYNFLWLENKIHTKRQHFS